jgi:hypothetical protein
VCPTNLTREEWDCKAQGLNLVDTVQKATLEVLTTFCGKHPDVVASTAAEWFLYLSDTLDHGSNAKLLSQLRATLTIVLIFSPQFVSLRPCLPPIDWWWEKVHSIDAKSTSIELKKWRTAQALKEARAVIATLKKGRRKDKAKIRELSEVTHEQNFPL